MLGSGRASRKETQELLARVDSEHIRWGNTVDERHKRRADPHPSLLPKTTWWAGLAPLHHEGVVSLPQVWKIKTCVRGVLHFVHTQGRTRIYIVLLTRFLPGINKLFRKCHWVLCLKTPRVGFPMLPHFAWLPHRDDSR